MNYNFNIEIAKQYGVNEAIMIANFQFWIAKNKANEQGFKDGSYWTYNSVKAFRDLFPFWSEKQIRTILNSLVKQNVLKTGNYNQSSYDRTLWYAFIDEEKWICPNGNFHFTKWANGFDQMGKPIPDNKPDIKPDNNPLLYSPLKEEGKKKDKWEDFEEFWSLFPKQRIGNKQKAYSSYVRVLKEKRASVEKLLSSVKAYADSEEVRNGYAKGCQAWLNDDRFNIDYNGKKSLFEGVDWK